MGISLNNVWGTLSAHIEEGWTVSGYPRQKKPGTINTHDPVASEINQMPALQYFSLL